MPAAAAQAQELRAGILTEAQRAAEHEKARRLYRVRLETLREQVQVQEAAFKEAVRRSQQQLAQARIGAAGAGALAEKPELTGRIVLLVAIPETMVILGFAVSAMILLLLTQ